MFNSKSGRFVIVLAIFIVCFPSSFASIHSVQTDEASRHFQRANELEAAGEPEAENEYRLAIAARNGIYPEALQRLAWLLQRKLRLSESSLLMTEYIRQTPNENHSADLVSLTKLIKASKLKEIIDVSEVPLLEDILQFIPLALGYAGRKSAEPYAERAVELYPTSIKALIALADLLEEKERKLNLLKKAMEIDPNNPNVHSELGRYYFSVDGSIAEAEAEFRKALELSKGSEASAWLGLGIIHEVRGQKKEAVEAYRNYLDKRKTPSQFDEEIKSKIDRLKREL